MAVMDPMDVKVEGAGGDNVAIQVTKVTGTRSRMRGMIKRSPMPYSSALLFRAKQVHTFGMDRPIDVLHLAPDGNVISVMTLGPNRLSRILLGARWVLEMESGEARRLGIIVGSRLLLDGGGRR